MMRLCRLACLSLLFGVLYPALSWAESEAQPPALKIQQWHTDNGVNVLFLPAEELPILDIRLVFKAGSSYDKAQYGLAALTNSLLDQGAGDLSADDIAAQFDSVGAVFSNDTDRDRAIVGLRTLTEEQYLKPALATFITTLSQPRFEQKAFAREQARTLRAIAAKTQSPDAVANDALYKRLYGNQPYGHPTLGTQSTVRNLQYVDVKQFYDQYYTSNNALLVMVGNVSLARAKLISENITKTLHQNKSIQKLTKPKQLSVGEQAHIERNIPQTAIRMGQVGIARSDARYFSLLVGNTILGGSMVSRLFDEVRVKRGLSYGVYSYFVTYAHEGPFVVRLQTRNQSTQEAITVANNVIKRFIEQGPTPVELEEAKQNLIGSFPVKLNGNRALLNALTNIAFYDLPPDYLETYRLNIAAVTVEAVKDAFQKTIRPQDFVTVTVGKQAAKPAPAA